MINQEPLASPVTPDWNGLFQQVRYLVDEIVRARDSASKCADAAERQVETLTAKAQSEIVFWERKVHALEAEVARLRGAIAAQDEREQRAGAACGVPREVHGCDWPDAVAEEVARLRALTTWQPIETAPKDGTVVMLFREIPPWRVRGFGYYWEQTEALQGWVSRGFDEPPGELGLAAPTHWMPLPAAPTAPREET